MNNDALKDVNATIDGLRSQLDIYMRSFAPKCLIDQKTESVTGYRAILN